MKRGAICKEASRQKTLFRVCDNPDDLEGPQTTVNSTEYFNYRNVFNSVQHNRIQSEHIT